LTFLVWRFALSIAAIGAWTLVSRNVRWPAPGKQWAHLALVGVLMHGGYLGGVWVAVKAGMAAGLAALIVCLQPVLTAAWMSWRGAEHRVRAHQWAGLVLGLGGLVLVVWRRMHGGEVNWQQLAPAVAALMAITVGTLYQKRCVAPADVRPANLIQLAAALVATAPFALLETGSMAWGVELSIALGWSVLGLTLGGSSLLYVLIQRGAATEVTSLLYLVPPCTALLAWTMFGEPITASMLIGMALCAFGVFLVRRG
jgi:drug/metabolite transporter (DMT)-like permease